MLVVNLRILKKLSKRAAPLLAAMGDKREQFPARRWENYGCPTGMERKHWERTRSVHDEVWGGTIKTPAADGRGWIALSPPDHPLKGTIMVGSVEGYYEPEWSETSAWLAFCDLVYIHFTDWAAEAEAETDDEPPRLLRPLDTVGQLFDAARDMIVERSTNRAAKVNARG